MKQLCQESVVDKLKSMLESAIDKAGGKDTIVEIEAVEISGGGARIPFVQETIRDVLGKEDDFVFARSLDDLAFGAALVGSLSETLSQDTDDNNMDDDRKSLREELLKDELAMSQQDSQYMIADELRNKIEALILELRSARHLFLSENYRVVAQTSKLLCIGRMTSGDIGLADGLARYPSLVAVVVV